MTENQYDSIIFVAGGTGFGASLAVTLGNISVVGSWGGVSLGMEA
ncbi:MAG: hypothetical protein SAJ12_04630 [Jaaginema sp. PMC 1079.18]|nr:hypothetical protein [Jaaginema sp. PMC 1080.18]MEC4850277.1 hypothetical protein [Jaaginema sp. PMC 1079.18]MEC4866897.1 hypothetical protein [Jaaginema sp. PMC 1078.18]